MTVCPRLYKGGAHRAAVGRGAGVAAAVRRAGGERASCGGRPRSHCAPASPALYQICHEIRYIGVSEPTVRPNSARRWRRRGGWRRRRSRSSAARSSCWPAPPSDPRRAPRPPRRASSGSQPVPLTVRRYVTVRVVTWLAQLFLAGAASGRPHGRGVQPCVLRARADVPPAGRRGARQRVRAMGRGGLRRGPFGILPPIFYGRSLYG